LGQIPQIGLRPTFFVLFARFSSRKEHRISAEGVKSSKWLFFVARKSPKNAKNLFDATPYAATTSDPIRAKNKNITGLGPRDLIVLDSFTMHVESRSRERNSARQKEHLSTLIFTD
jgi:hypothetical protein